MPCLAWTCSGTHDERRQGDEQQEERGQASLGSDTQVVVMGTHETEVELVDGKDILCGGIGIGNLPVARAAAHKRVLVDHAECHSPKRLPFEDGCVGQKPVGLRCLLLRTHGERTGSCDDGECDGGCQNQCPEPSVSDIASGDYPHHQGCEATGGEGQKRCTRGEEGQHDGEEGNHGDKEDASTANIEA